MKNFMSIDKGLPRDDDRAMYLDVKLSDTDELKEFETDGGMVNVKYFHGEFYGQAYDENGHVCLGLSLKSVTHWKYSDV